MVIENATPINMGGIILDQALPIGLYENIGPFLLLHHWKSNIDKGSKPNELGVGPHPHRGFSPVTFIYQGAVQHRDSRGNNSTVFAGGVQWMNAGMGIIHSERPPASLAQSGGPFELIQIWINTPKAHKMDQPKYIAKDKEDIPTVTIGHSDLQVVAGNYEGVVGAIEPLSAMNIWNIVTKADDVLDLMLNGNWSALIYVVKGSIKVDSELAHEKQVILLPKRDEDYTLNMSITANSKFLILTGADIDEPISQYGPFVMNTQTEVLEALRDAQLGKMGVLIEEF